MGDLADGWKVHMDRQVRTAVLAAVRKTSLRRLCLLVSIEVLALEALAALV